MFDKNNLDTLFEDGPGSLKEVFDKDDAEDLKLHKSLANEST
jgi:hypothetical protein